MPDKDNPINPHKRYVRRLSDLAKRDPQIAALRPREEVRDVACDPTLTYDRVILKGLSKGLIKDQKYRIYQKNICINVCEICRSWD